MINLDVMYNEFGGDAETVKMVLNMYLEQYNGCEEKFDDLYGAKNWGELYMLAHSLKGLLLGFGEQSVTCALADIENSTRDKNEPEKGLVDKVVIEIPKVNTFIENHVKGI